MYSDPAGVTRETPQHSSQFRRAAVVLLAASGPIVLRLRRPAPDNPPPRPRVRMRTRRRRFRRPAAPFPQPAWWACGHRCDGSQGRELVRVRRSAHGAFGTPRATVGIGPAQGAKKDGRVSSPQKRTKHRRPPRVRTGLNRKQGARMTGHFGDARWPERASDTSAAMTRVTANMVRSQSGQEKARKASTRTVARRG
jgi:hypothetical protein